MNENGTVYTHWGTLKEKNREINIEILRIIAMFFVILYHEIIDSEILHVINITNTNFLIVGALTVISRICNGLFIIITGYYMITSEFKLKKILILWGKTIFYSILIYTIFNAFTQNCNPEIKNFLPVLSGHYWFISAYIALYFVAPIINLGVKKLSKSQYRYLLVILTIFYAIVCAGYIDFIYQFVGVIYVYLVGVYIRLHKEKNEKNGYYLLKALISLLIVCIVKLLLFKISGSLHSNIAIKYANILFLSIDNFFSIFIIIPVVCIFMEFKNIKIKDEKFKKLISVITPSILSVYILHENINVKELIWKKIFKIREYASSAVLVPRMLAYVLIVFAVCLGIDFIFRGIYKCIKAIPPINMLIRKLNEKVEKMNRKLQGILSSEKT